MKFEEFMAEQKYDLTNVLATFIMKEQGDMAKEMFEKLINTINKSKTSPITDMQACRILLENQIDLAMKYMPKLHKSYKEESWEDKGASVAMLMNGIHQCFIVSLQQYACLLEECVDNVDPSMQKQMVTLWNKDNKIIKKNIMAILTKIAEKVEGKKHG